MFIFKLTLGVVLVFSSVHCKPQYGSSNWPNSNQDNTDTTYKKPWYLDPANKNSDGSIRVGSNSGFDLDFGNKISKPNNEIVWDKDTHTFFEESNNRFEKTEKAAKTIFGIVIGVMIGIFVLIVLSILACCFLPACMCYKARNSRNVRGVVHQPVDPNTTQPLYPVQSQAAAYPVQGSQIQVQMGGYGPPPVYPFPTSNTTQQTANWQAPPPDKQAPYNPYYGGNGQQQQIPNNPNLGYPHN